MLLARIENRKGRLFHEQVYIIGDTLVSNLSAGSSYLRSSHVIGELTNDVTSRLVIAHDVDLSGFADGTTDS